MLAAIIRGVTSAIGKVAKKVGGTAKPSPKPPRPAPNAVRKPNKVIIRKPQPVAPRKGTGKALVPAPRTAPPAKPSLPPANHPGNTLPPDMGSADRFNRIQVPSGLPPHAAHETPAAGAAGQDHKDAGLALMTAVNVAQQFASSFIPSITWTATITARGYKSTPLRTVLHYCLALAFGTGHQARLGSSNLTATLFPNENRVEVTFLHSSSLLLEPVNVGFNWLDHLLPDLDELSRTVSNPEKMVAGIEKWITDQIDPTAGARDFAKFVGDQIRELGPGGIWDMARSNYYAGDPPATMILDESEPYTSMRKWGQIEKRPLLTRSLAENPQADKFPEKHHPTAFDLRSLVAQALYDPGVIPPTPDTVVALPDELLP